MKKLAKYEVLGELGHGAMGVVYRAHDPIINRPVALKTITTGVADDPAMLQRFYREAQSAGGLHHPNIVTIYDMGEAGTVPYIAMELVEGENLDQVIARRPNLPLTLKLSYIMQACGALDYAHKRGIVHRDIKPGNVMVSKDGTVKVVDFGIARVLDTSRTMTGMLIGTFAYMSPEQYHGEHADERSDVWSFGVLAYELLTYQRPFSGPTPASLMHNICNENPAPLSKALPDCPKELEAVVSKMLHKSPQQRYQTMEEVLLDLDPLCKTLQSQSINDLLEQSRQLFEQAKFAESRDLVRQVLQLDSGNQLARTLLENTNLELRRVLNRPKAQQLVDNGQTLLEEGKLEEAKIAAEKALQLDSNFTAAGKLQRAIQNELDRVRRVASMLDSAKQHLAEGLPEEAEKLIDKVLEADPSDAQAQNLLRQVLKEKAECEQARRLLTGLQQARELWMRQNYSECLQLLQALEDEFPAEEEVLRLRDTVHEDQLQQQKQQKLLQSRNLLAAGRHDEAIVLLTDLQKQYPTDEEIPGVLEDVRKDQLNQRRLAGVNEARNLLVAGQLDACIALATALCKSFPDDPEIVKVLETAQQNKTELARLRGITAVSKLLATRQHKDCLALLVKLENQFPGDEDVLALHKAVHEDQAEFEKQQALEEARGLLTSRNYNQQVEFPGEDSIVKLLDSTRKEQAEQSQREGLKTARNLLGAGHYGESITLLRKLQADFPEEAEISKLLANAQEDLAEQQKQLKLSDARNLLAAQSFEKALQILNNLAAAHPKDSTVVKLRALVEREQGNCVKAERIQGELDILKKLMGDKKYPEVIAQASQLLKEFPGEPNFTRLGEFAASRQAGIEQEQLLTQKQNEAKALLETSRFEEAMRITQTALKIFPGNAELQSLYQQSESGLKKLHVRQQIEQRIREIKVKINREELSDAVALAEQTLVTLGPDTDLKSLLNSAQVEMEAREKKRLQESALETIRTMIDSGDLDGASHSIDKVIESRTLESYDPRIQRLSDRIKEAKSSPTFGEPTAPQATEVPGLSKEYALATPILEAAPAPEKPPTADLTGTALYSASTTAVPERAAPGKPSEPVPRPPETVAPIPLETPPPEVKPARLSAARSPTRAFESGQEQPVPAVPPAVERYRIPLIAAVALFAALLALVGLNVGGLRSRIFGGSGSPRIESIAVLPFVNVSKNPKTEYLSDGITESLIDTLSQLPNLAVMSRNTVFRYKDQETDPQKIGRDLHVQAILTGRLIQNGDELLISVNLEDVQNSRQIWGEQYNRNLSNLLSVQREIAADIFGRLRPRLEGDDRTLVPKETTENAEAYQLYLQGLFYWNKWTYPDFVRAADYFSQAVQKDPRYALAYAGLADTYSLLGNSGYVPPPEAWPKAETAAKQALAIDGSLAEAHTSLGLVKEHFEWDWPGADQQFQRAIELNSSSANAHHWYGDYLANMGRFDDGLRETHKALESDPLSLVINTTVGRQLYLSRQYDPAVEQLRKVLDMDPKFAPARTILEGVYAQMGKQKEAVAEREKMISLSGGPELAAAIEHEYATSGYRGVLQSSLKGLTEMSRHEYVSPYIIAQAYMRTGDQERALEWLEKAYREHDSGLVSVAVDPMFDPLRSNARLQEILRQMKLAK